MMDHYEEANVIMINNEGVGVKEYDDNDDGEHRSSSIFLQNRASLMFSYPFNNSY